MLSLCLQSLLFVLYYKGNEASNLLELPQFTKTLLEPQRVMVTEILGRNGRPYKIEFQAPIYENWQNEFITPSAPAPTYGGDVGPSPLAPGYQLAEFALNRDLERFLSLLSTTQPEECSRRLQYLSGLSVAGISATVQGALAIEFLEALQMKNVDFQRTMKGDVTSLHLAVEARNLAAVQWLSKNTYIDPNHRSTEMKENVVFPAVRHYVPKILYFLVTEARASTTDINLIGETPLHLAIKHRNRIAAKALLSFDTDHGAQDATGKTSLQYAVEYGEYDLVEAIVFHPTFLSRMERTKKRQSTAHIQLISRLMGKVSVKALQRLLWVETSRFNTRLCHMGERGQTLLWRLIKGMLDLPESHRQPAILTGYSNMIGSLINFHIYVRIHRVPGYKFCNPHTLGYTGHADTKDPLIADLTGRIPLEFLNNPYHPLCNNHELKRRLYLLPDPLGDHPLIARLAKHSETSPNLKRILEKRPEWLSYHSFLLGRTFYLDGLRVLVQMRRWGVVKDVLGLISACMEERKLEKPKNYHNDMVYVACRTSLKNAVIDASASEDRDILEVLVARDPSVVSSILSETEIKDTFTIKTLEFILPGCINVRKEFHEGRGKLSPLENAIVAHLEDKTGYGQLTDIHYIETLLSHPWIWYSKRKHLKNSMEIIAESLLYGFVHRYPNGKLYKLDNQDNWTNIFEVFRNPPTSINAFRREYKEPQRPHELSLILGDEATRHPEINPMYLAGMKNDVVPAVLRGIERPRVFSRPSNKVVEGIQNRRRDIIKAVFRSPIPDYDPLFRHIERTVLYYLFCAFALRIAILTIRAVLTRGWPFGDVLGEQTGRRASDAWEMIYAPCKGRILAALWYAVKCSFLMRVGTRHHNWGTIPMIIPILEIHINAFFLMVLFAWTIWTWSLDVITPILIAQGLVFIISFVGAYRMSELGALLLLANFFPIGIQDLSKKVKLTIADITYWPYKKSKNIHDEFVLEHAILERINEIRRTRINPYHARVDMTFSQLWNDKSDRTLLDIIHVLQELLGNESFEETKGLQRIHPIKYGKVGLIDPDRMFRLEHPQKLREDPAIEALRTSAFTVRTPHDHKGWVSEADLDEQSVSSEDVRDVMFLFGRNGWKRELVTQPPKTYPPEPTKKLPPSKTWKELISPPRSVEEATAARQLIRPFSFHPENDYLPTIEQWERFTTPPAFLYEVDHNKYLGSVRVPNLAEVQRVQRELHEPLNDPRIQRFVDSLDLLRLQRRTEHLMDIGAVDMGHLPSVELKRRLHIINTLEYLPLFYHFPTIRRLTTRAFFAGSVDPMIYGLVSAILELIAFGCTVVPWSINSFGEPRLHFSIARVYNNPFLQITGRVARSASVLLGFSESFVLSRLVVEIIRPVGIHIMLSAHAFSIGNIFSWKNIVPYFGSSIATGMRRLSNVRRIACRRFDNLVEVSVHQLDPLLVIMFLAYLPFAFFLQSTTDVFFLAHLVVVIFGMTLAVAMALLFTAITGYAGNRSLEKLVTMTAWFHRLTDPSRIHDHAATVIADKMAFDPALSVRNNTLLGFVITEPVMVTFCSLILIITSAFGFHVYYTIFPQTTQRA